MASIRQLNQQSPFWDFIASLEDQFGRPSGFNNGEPSGPHPPRGHAPPHRGSWHRGPMPHHPHHPHHHHPRGPHHPPPPPHHSHDGPGDHRGPPHPPPHHDGEHNGERDHPPPPPPDYEVTPDTLMGNEKAAEKTTELPPNDEGVCSSDDSGNEESSHPHHHRRHGRCSRRGRGGPCERGRHAGPEGHPGRGRSHGRGHSHGRRGPPGAGEGAGGPWGGWGRMGRGFGFGSPPHHHHDGHHHEGHGHGGPGAWGAAGLPPLPDFANRWMEFLAGEWAQASGQGSPHQHRQREQQQQEEGVTRANADDASTEGQGQSRDFPSFTPPADVFDTPSSYVLHIPLPGAKKEDVDVSWDAELSTLTVSGVTYRPGGEEFLATLALDEREVGHFQRSVRLGSRASPANVLHEGITARLEEGVLVVEVPRGEEGFVEVRKVEVL